MDIKKMMNDLGWTRILQIRQALLQYGFWRTETINSIISQIDARIGVIKYDYDQSNSCITIQVRKTMLKRNNMKHDAISYYPLISSIMSDIIINYRSSVLDCLATYFGIKNKNTCKELFDLYNWIISDSSCLSNMVNVQCIGDNVVQIIL